MQTIYNEQGVAKTLDSVDAREHVATGRWFRELLVKEPELKHEVIVEVIDAAAAISDSTEESKPETTAKAASKAKKEKEVTTEVMGE